MMAILFAMVAMISCQVDDSNEERNPLIARAGQDRQVVAGAVVALDGRASKDEEGGVFSYLWSFKSKPAGSQATFDDATTGTPEFVADKWGTYVIELLISKGSWYSKDELLITASEGTGTQTVIISEDITADMIMEDIFEEDWTRSDYLILKPINLQAKLTIKPGVKVAFAENASLTVTATGAFISEGGDQEESRIYLTGEQETPGSWSGILFQSDNPDNKMVHTSLSYAGGDSDLYPSNAGIWLDDAGKLRIENSYFTNNKGMAISLSPGATLVSFRDNYLKGMENGGPVLALPAHEVKKIVAGNQVWNGDIAVTTSSLESGDELVWGQYSYTLLEGLKIINGTGLELHESTIIRIAADKQIALLNGGFMKALGADTRPVEIRGAAAHAGYWKGIFIEHSNGNPSVFRYASVWNAGSSPLAGDHPASLHLGPYAEAAIDFSSINLGGGDGVEATSEGATLLSFSSNTIRGHAGYPIAVSAKNVSIIDPETYFINNVTNKVRIDGNYAIASDLETVWQGFAQANISYHIKGLSNDLLVWSGLKLEAGVTLEMENEARIVVEDANGRQGYIHATGTSDKHVVFKHVNNIAGSWYGITFSNMSQNNYLEYTEVLYAGKKVENSFSANIIVDNSPEGRLTIINSVVGYSGQHGIAILNEKRENLNDAGLTFLEIPESTVYTW